MRIIVASDIELGSPRAHAINVIKTAGGFARLGHDVTVVCREGAPVGSAAAAFGEPLLSWRCASASDRRGEGRAREFAQMVMDEAADADVLYARHFRSALAGAQAGVPTVLETHAYIGDENPVLDEAFAATRRAERPLTISTISRRLIDHYVDRGAARERMLLTPDGVDVELFTPSADRGDDPMAGAPGPRLLYAGHLYDYKGVPTLIEAAGLAPDVSLHLLGGVDEDIARVRAAATGTNVHVHGRVAHTDVPRWLWWADVLALVPSATEPSCAWTSPVKLGEYLASGVPIVASDIPALRDWVDDSVVTWCAPDDASSLADAVKRAIDAEPNTERRERAQRLASTFRYERRASRLLEGALGGIEVDA